VRNSAAPAPSRRGSKDVAEDWNRPAYDTYMKTCMKIVSVVYTIFSFVMDPTAAPRTAVSLVLRCGARTLCVILLTKAVENRHHVLEMALEKSSQVKWLLLKLFPEIFKAQAVFVG
jgi:hypothetical protein